MKKQSTIEGLSELPAWVNTRTWNAYLEQRKQKKAANTAYALELILKKLDGLRVAGHDPNCVLDQSIECGYTGVFELKAARPVAPWQQQQQPTQERRYMTSVEPPLTEEQRKASAEARDRVMSTIRPNLRRVG